MLKRGHQNPYCLQHQMCQHQMTVSLPLVLQINLSTVLLQLPRINPTQCDHRYLPQTTAGVFINYTHIQRLLIHTLLLLTLCPWLVKGLLIFWLWTWPLTFWTSKSTPFQHSPNSLHIPNSATLAQNVSERKTPTHYQTAWPSYLTLSMLNQPAHQDFSRSSWLPNFMLNCFCAKWHT